MWCHSNANPYPGGAGYNAYRVPQWDNTSKPCTICHDGKGPEGSWTSNTDNLSRGHALHIGTDRYQLSCTQCHWGTVQSVNDKAIAVWDNHVSGRKDVVFNAVRGTAGVVQTVGTFDNASGANPYKCNNLYCHSSGVDNNASGGFTGAALTPRWDNTGITSCTYCHGGNKSSSSPIASGSHTGLPDHHSRPDPDLPVTPGDRPIDQIWLTGSDPS